MRRKGALRIGVVSGITSPGTLGATGNYPISKDSDLQRLRGDVENVGGDFSTVIRRHNGAQQQAESKPIKR